MNNYDVCVVGGGMVGAATAIGLAKMGLSVAVLEAQIPESYAPEQGPDLRASAINHHSEQLLETLGAWQDLQTMRMCPFKRMAVWEAANARTQFNCDDIQHSHLGHIVENRLIQLALLNQFAAFPNIDLIHGRPERLQQSESSCTVTIDNHQILSCTLLVGADGGMSNVRQWLNIGQQGWQYQQHAMGINIEMADHSQQDITWQAFHPSGPRAFLPLYNGFASLVWYDSAARIAQLKKLNHDKLKAEIVEAFPAQLGDFSVLAKASFPLTRMHANQYVKGNAVLVGDAAHTINPLAGQGVNLGFKDVSALLDALQSWNKCRSDLIHRLAEYEANRRKQNLLMMSTMDVIYAMFSNDFAPLKLLRNAGLALADKAGPLKHQVMKFAMGLE